MTLQTQNVEEQFQTTSEDLAGFWDLVMIQVDDVRLMFTEIEQLRQNAWKELCPPEVGLSIVLNLLASLTGTANEQQSVVEGQTAESYTGLTQ